MPSAFTDIIHWWTTAVPLIVMALLAAYVVLPGLDGTVLPPPALVRMHATAEVASMYSRTANDWRPPEFPTDGNGTSMLACSCAAAPSPRRGARSYTTWSPGARVAQHLRQIWELCGAWRRALQWLGIGIARLGGPLQATTGTPASAPSRARSGAPAPTGMATHSGERSALHRLQHPGQGASHEGGAQGDWGTARCHTDNGRIVRQQSTQLTAPLAPGVDGGDSVMIPQAELVQRLQELLLLLQESGAERGEVKDSASVPSKATLGRIDTMDALEHLDMVDAV